MTWLQLLGIGVATWCAVSVLFALFLARLAGRFSPDAVSPHGLDRDGGLIPPVDLAETA